MRTLRFAYALIITKQFTPPPHFFISGCASECDYPSDNDFNLNYCIFLVALTVVDDLSNFDVLSFYLSLGVTQSSDYFYTKPP